MLFRSWQRELAALQVQCAPCPALTHRVGALRDELAKAHAFYIDMPAVPVLADMMPMGTA